MIVNGNEMDLGNESTIINLLDKLSLDKEKVVVEVNRDIIPKENFYDYILNEEDKVEIISFVGGG